MNTSADLSFIVWLLLMLIFLIAFVGSLFLSPARKKRLDKLLSLFSEPEQCQHQFAQFAINCPNISIAAQILESWFPHLENEYIEGAPVPVCGRFHKLINYNADRGEIELELFYKSPIEIKNLKIAERQSKARFKIAMEHVYKNSSKEGVILKYQWQGAESAISDIFSSDYRVLHYLMDRIEKEFESRGYKKDSKVQPPGQRNKSKAPKQWWRSFSAGSQGERSYSYWPSPANYLESVQNPEHNFKDESLQKASVELTALGIPRVASGMFASVYHFTTEKQEWAVRCFDTRLRDQQERYKAISNFIIADDLPYTVDFHYIEDGIKCGDSWFPILKMDWVEGLPLDAYIRDTLEDKAALQALRLEFRCMMEQLRANGIAHGDLQHGNILISGGLIYLVDYDGFYVPELAGRHSNELGHANYQHPRRNESFFGPTLDNFSAWVIDLSITALIIDPGLWQRFSGGDECLLFRKSDFLDPEKSKLFAELQNHASIELREGANRLKEFLSMPAEDIPYLQMEGTAQSIKIEELESAN